MQVKCHHCEKEFDAKRKTAKYCSEACKKAAQRDADKPDDVDKPADNQKNKASKEEKVTHDAPTKFLGELRKSKLGF